MGVITLRAEFVPFAVSITGGDPTLCCEYFVGCPAASLHPGTYALLAAMHSWQVFCICVYALQPHFYRLGLTMALCPYTGLVFENFDGIKPCEGPWLFSSCDECSLVCVLAMKFQNNAQITVVEPERVVSKNTLTCECHEECKDFTVEGKANIVPC